MADVVCVGDAFSIDGGGVLQLKVAGGPAETGWPYAGPVATDNPVRVDPVQGLWVPPTPYAVPVDKVAQAAPGWTVTSGATHDTDALLVKIVNPSKDYPMVYDLTAHCSFQVYVNVTTNVRVGFQSSLAPLTTGGYGVAKDREANTSYLGPWWEENRIKHTGSIPAGGSMTVYSGIRFTCLNGASMSVTSYEMDVRGHLLVGPAAPAGVVS
jgi:hypothetical protein